MKSFTVIPGHDRPPRRPVTAYVAIELVGLRSEAWRISERKRTVRAEIEALREIEKNQ